MPKKTIGLRGYIGEEIVEQWLRCKYPESAGYKIKYQILPTGVEKTGGPYLDFGILRNGFVEYLYEVKTQDYKLAKLNKALKYFWENLTAIETFEVQDDSVKYPIGSNCKAYLILLVKPDFTNAEIEILKKFKDNVLYFADIFADASFQIDFKAIKDDFLKDYESEIKFLKAKSKSRTARKM